MKKILFYLLILSIPLSFRFQLQIRSLGIENLSVAVLISSIIFYFALLTIFLRKPSPSIKSYLIPIIFLFTGYLVGVLMAGIEISSLKTFLNMILSLGVSIAIYFLPRSNKELKNGIFLLLFLITIFTILQFYGMLQGEIRWVNIARGMYSRNYTAFILLSFLPFSITGTSFSQTGQKRFIYFLLTVLLMAGLLFAYSRGGILASILGLITASFLIRKKMYGKKYAKFILLLILTITICSMILMPSSLKQRMLSVIDISEQQYQSTNLDRIVLTKTGLRIIVAHPILGIGVGKFDEEYQNYLNPEEETLLSKPQYPSSHNQYIHVWNEGGILGFLGLIILLFLLLKTFRNYLNNPKMDENSQILIIGCLILWLTYGWYFLFAWPLQRIIFWVALGISLATIKLYKKNVN